MTAKTLVEMTVEIVNTYINSMQIDVHEVPKLIEDTHRALQKIAATVERQPVVKQLQAPAPLHPRRTGHEKGRRVTQGPAVPISQSITDDYLICLEDGRRYKMLKGPLRSRYNMSPDQYRAKWGLPPDYPMTAPSYSEARKRISDQIGLGRDIIRGNSR